MAPHTSIFIHMLQLLLLLLVRVEAKREHVALIPNGDNVGVAHALGHIAWDGDGPLNAFGEAFAAAGFKWTRSLCKGDADGDGQTNGEELGDPCCTWVAGSGALPLITDVLSHPGDFGRKLNSTDLHHRQLVCQAAEAAMVSSSASSGVGQSAGQGGPGQVDASLKSGRPAVPPTADLPSSSSTSPLRPCSLCVFTLVVAWIFIFV